MNFNKYIVKENYWSSDYREGEVVAYSIPRNIYDIPPNTFKVVMFYGDNNLILARTKKYFDRMYKQMKGNK